MIVPNFIITTSSLDQREEFKYIYTKIFILQTKLMTFNFPPKRNKPHHQIMQSIVLWN